MNLPARAGDRRLLLVAAAVLALAFAAFTAATTGAGAATRGVAHDTPCSPVSGHHNFEDPPPGVSNPDNYATCDDCRPIAAGTKCHLWWGAQTPDGGDGGVSHKGWPGLTGIRFQVTSDTDRGQHKTGSRFNDGLYGRNGSDTLVGGDGDDVIWGDSNIQHNGTGQKDVLEGDGGNDWIYASHGKNTITGGAGNDTVFAYYGKGTIDCGAGNDTITVLKKTPYKLKNCERVKHPGKG